MVIPAASRLNPSWQRDDKVTHHAYLALRRIDLSAHAGHCAAWPLLGGRRKGVLCGGLAVPCRQSPFPALWRLLEPGCKCGGHWGTLSGFSGTRALRHDRPRTRVSNLPSHPDLIEWCVVAAVALGDCWGIDDLGDTSRKRGSLAADSAQPVPPGRLRRADPGNAYTIRPPAKCLPPCPARIRAVVWTSVYCAAPVLRFTRHARKIAGEMVANFRALGGIGFTNRAFFKCAAWAKLSYRCKRVGGRPACPSSLHPSNGPLRVRSPGQLDPQALRGRRNPLVSRDAELRELCHLDLGGPAALAGGPSLVAYGGTRGRGSFVLWRDRRRDQSPQCRLRFALFICTAGAHQFFAPGLGVSETRSGLPCGRDIGVLADCRWISRVFHTECADLRAWP